MSNIKVRNSYVWLPVLLLSALSTVAGCARLRPIPEGVDPVTVKGEIVQANTDLFRPGAWSNPAKIRDNVLFPNTWIPKAALPQLEAHVASLKEYPPIPTGATDPYQPPN